MDRLAEIDRTIDDNQYREYAKYDTTAVITKEN